VAYLIDGLILGGVGLVIVLPIALCLILALTDPVTTVDGRTVDGPATATLILSLLGIAAGIAVLSTVLAYLYHVEFALRGGGQTYGKRVAKVRIVPLDPAQTLTRRHLAIRYFSQVGLGLVPAGGLVDGLFQLWDKPYQQCLHDKAAKTVVVRLIT
jgi:uncharacterized RDD family membrane protein YckC